MSNEKLYSAAEICNILKITNWTLTNWYRWEKQQLNGGIVEKEYLPKPIRLEHTKGSPRRWTKPMVEELKEYKKHIIIGRNGTYGMYSNPYHRDTKKYKNSLKQVEAE